VSSAEFQRMEQALFLLESAVDMIPYVSWDNMFANDYGARVCLTVAARQLRASAFLAFIAYYPESRILLRSVYESASLARVLAKDPDLAERWLRKHRMRAMTELRTR
jgi:hypothetical protein